MIKNISPIFTAVDFAALVDEYRRLGFDVNANPSSVSPDDYGYAFARRDEACLHLAELSRSKVHVVNTAAYFFVEDADALYDEWRSANVPGELSEPEDTEYGVREGTYVDQGGNIIRFGSAIDEERARQEASPMEKDAVAG